MREGSEGVPNVDVVGFSTAHKGNDNRGTITESYNASLSLRSTNGGGSRTIGVAKGEVVWVWIVPKHAISKEAGEDQWGEALQQWEEWRPWWNERFCSDANATLTKLR